MDRLPKHVQLEMLKAFMRATFRREIEEGRAAVFDVAVVMYQADRLMRQEPGTFARVVLCD